LRKPDPAQQSGIAWVGVEIVQFRVKFQVINELAFVLSVLRPLASDARILQMNSYRFRLAPWTFRKSSGIIAGCEGREEQL
jgi:hypothetical protein